MEQIFSTMGLSLNLTARLAIATAFATVLVAAGATNNRFNLKPFKIDLTGGIPRLKSLVNSTRLPDKAIYPDAGTDKGIELETLHELQTEWATTFDWEVQQAELNQSVPLILVQLHLGSCISCV
jgi:hypothetical protein